MKVGYILYKIESLTMVLWGLNIPYTVSDNQLFVNGEDISNYSKKKLKEFFNKQLEGEI